LRLYEPFQASYFDFAFHIIPAVGCDCFWWSCHGSLYPQDGSRTKKWLSDESFRAGVALCQVIPGATAMQMAAYVGLRAHGVTGAVVTYTGFGLPAFLIMIFLSALYFQTYNYPIAISLFKWVWSDYCSHCDQCCNFIWQKLSWSLEGFGISSSCG
jgi:Chromate transporter